MIYTMITLTTVGHSTHTLYDRGHADLLFHTACAAVPSFVEAIFLYGPEGMINNWWRERK